MKRYAQKFPDLQKAQATTEAMASVQINGQKVLFDKKVTLLPIELKRKNERWISS